MARVAARTSATTPPGGPMNVMSTPGGRASMQHTMLLCVRCGAWLAPTISGLRCPRLAACGFGGFVETGGFQSSRAFLAQDGHSAA